MRCYNCHGESDVVVEKCQYCGCSPELAAAKDEPEYKAILNKAFPIIQLLAPFFIMLPVLIIAMVMISIFGYNPDRLIVGLIIIIALVAVAVLIYGTVFQVRLYRKLHRSTTKTTMGKTVAFYKPYNRSSYMRVIEFEVNGKKYRHVSKYDNPDKLETGVEVEIGYNYHNPYDNFIARDHRGLILILVTLAVIALFGGISLYVHSQMNDGPLLKA